jgi:hypothetical protein
MMTVDEVKALLAKPTISPDELYRASILPLSRNGIYAAIQRGEIEAIPFGHKKAIVTSALRKKLGMEAA